MVIQIDRVFENRGLGITFLKLRDYSVSKLTSSVDGIRLEMKAPLVGIKRRAIQQFDYIEERDEYHISAIIDVPIKIKELFIEEDELKTHERVEYFARNIEAIIQLKTATIILFSQSQREVRKFSKYIKEITLNGFKPVPIKFNSEGMRKMVKDFEIVHRIKISESGNQSVKSIRFDGQNLLDDDLVSEILSNGNFEIAEIGGIRPLSSDSYVKFYMNNRGRVCIYGDQNTITTKNIYNLIQDIEKMIPREHNLRQRGSD
jgi:hypothetical protein